MSHTNLVLGGNWEKGEWPEFVDVGHEGSCDGKRYLPHRTCHDVSYGDEEFRCSECGMPVEVECDGFVLLIGGKTDNLRFCPNCGAMVVSE